MVAGRIINCVLGGVLGIARLLLGVKKWDDGE